MSQELKSSQEFKSAIDSGKDSEEEFEFGTHKRRRRVRIFDSGDESSNNSNASPVKPLRHTVLAASLDDSVAEESQDEGSLAGKAVTELCEAPVTQPEQGGMWYSLTGPSHPLHLHPDHLLKVRHYFK